MPSHPLTHLPPDGSDALALRRRLRVLEQEASLLYQALEQSGADQEVPGAHLILDSAGFSALFPVSQVAELVRLPAMEPIVGSPPFVLGSFLCRGKALVAVDLAQLLGHTQLPSVHAHVMVLVASEPVALVVDRVHMVVDSVQALANPGMEDAEPWTSSGLAALLCKANGRLLPLLSVDRLLCRLGKVTP